MMAHYPTVTRFEVIDHRTILPVEDRGIRVHILGADVSVSVEDQGKTLRVFLKDREDGVTPEQVQTEWDAALGHDLKTIMEYYAAGTIGRNSAAMVTRQPGGNTSVA